MASPHEIPPKAILSPELFLADFESTRECFPLVGGIMGARGETETVEVGNYHAAMRDFFDDEKLRHHLMASSKAPVASLPLEIAPDFKYAFDNGEGWFRIGKVAFLHVVERRIPVRTVRLDFENFSASWIYREEREVEEPAR
jgi:hypothetical protein